MTLVGDVLCCFFLNNGFKSEYFKELGKVPNDRDLLHMWFKGQLMKEPSFSNLVDISSYPWEDFYMIDLITDPFSLANKDLSVIFWGGVGVEGLWQKLIGVVLFFMFLLWL